MVFELVWVFVEFRFVYLNCYYIFVVFGFVKVLRRRALSVFLKELEKGLWVSWFV